MTKTESLSITVDQRTKSGAEQLFSQQGFTIADAINIFLRQALVVGGFPFNIMQPNVSAAQELLLAQEERKNGYVGRSADEVLAEMKTILREARNGQK